MESSQPRALQVSAVHPRSVLVSGASGLLGSALCVALQQKGIQVVQLVRRNATNPSAKGPSADKKRGTALEDVSPHGLGMRPELLEWDPDPQPGVPPVVDSEPLEGLDAAIHLSGANVAARPWTTLYKREITTSRIASTQTLTKILAGLRRPPKVLVSASATGFYGDRGDEILTEASPAGTGFLADLCRQWEAAAQPAIDFGMRVVSLRLGIILGPGGGALSRLVPMFRMGLGGPLGDGRQWMSWISLPDAVAAILFAIQYPNLAEPARALPALSGPVNAVSPNPVTNAEFTRALGRAVHRPALIPAPAFALRLAFGQMADEALLAGNRVQPARLMAADFPFAHPTLDLALEYAVR